MSTYDYQIQGVPLTDRRWDAAGPGGPHGVWFMRRGTAVLPKFPGLRATRFTRPGQHGESVAQYAPLEPRTHEVNMRFLAICSDPQHPRYRQEGRTFDERVAFLEQNINEFFFRTRIGATPAGGNLELKRFNNEAEHFPNLGAGNFTHGEQTTTGRLLASTEPAMDPEGQFADYDFIFEIPTGTWWTETLYQEVELPNPGETVAVDVPMGTAPVWDSQVAIYPTTAGFSLRDSTFLNDMGVGFKMRYNVDHWWIWDTEMAVAADALDGDEPVWGGDFDRPDTMIDVGRPLGSTLLINPGIPGSSDRLGRVNITLTDPGRVVIAHNPRFF